MKIDKNKWYKYIKLYEEFNSGIPVELKKIYDRLDDDIYSLNQSFEQTIDLNDYEFVNMKLNIEVNFKKLPNSILPYADRRICYYSNININDIIQMVDPLDIPINIVDDNIQRNRLLSVIAHEIRHIYDIYTISDDSDYASFTNELYLQVLRKEKITQEFNNFLHVLYLSLEHELVARNSMVYHNFMGCNIPYEEVIKIFEQSYLYESFMDMLNFKSESIIESDNILNQTNDLIKYIGGNVCKNEEDIKEFYDNWEKYFKKKADEYITEAHKVIKDISIVKESKKHTNRKAKDLLIDIYNKYIK